MEGELDVDIVDIVSVASRWQARPGDARYDLRYDWDLDADIDIVDIMRVAGRWGEQCGATPTSAETAER